MHRAVFVDRDGTVITDKAYLATAEGVELLPRAGEALASLMQHGFLIVLITNQSGVGRGYFSSEAVDEQHRRLSELLQDCGVVLAGIEVCPHAPWKNCSCRKPAPGMIHRAAEKLGIDPRASYMIGDKASDVLAGKRAGCTAVLGGDGNVPEADWTAADLFEAARWILGRTQQKMQEKHQ